MWLQLTACIPSFQHPATLLAMVRTIRPTNNPLPSRICVECKLLCTRSTTEYDIGSWYPRGTYTEYCDTVPYFEVDRCVELYKLHRSCRLGGLSLTIFLRASAPLSPSFSVLSPCPAAWCDDYYCTIMILRNRICVYHNSDEV